MKKPDRFERLAYKFTYTSYSAYGDYVGPSVKCETVAKLLRAEHRAIERMVKQMRDEYHASSYDWCMIDRVLANLKRRRG